MTTTNETTERVVVLPEITLPAGAKEHAAEVAQKLADVLPQLEELSREIGAIRSYYDEVLVGLYPALGTGSDEVHEVAAELTGWDPVFCRATDIGDLFDMSNFDGTALTNAEIARGGQRNIPVGAVANILDPSGVPVRVMIQRVPQQEDDNYTVVNLANVDVYYSCTHDELRSGLEVGEGSG